MPARIQFRNSIESRHCRHRPAQAVRSTTWVNSTLHGAIQRARSPQARAQLRTAEFYSPVLPFNLGENMRGASKAVNRAVLGAFACVMFAAASVFGAEPLKIAYSDWPGYVAWEVALQKGFFKDAGVDVQF